MSLKKLIRGFVLGAFLAAGLRLDCFAAPITPDAVYRGTVGGFNLIIADFTAGTADDGDTWASGLTGIVVYWTSDNDNPTTQASVGVAAANSAGTFTFYPAEDNKPFTLFVLTR